MNLEMKNNLKRVFVTLVGLCFLGAGVAIDTAAGWGTDCLAGFNEALASHISFISFGQMTTLVEVLMVIISFLLCRRTVGVGTLMTMLLVQFPIDLVYDLLPRVDTPVLKIVYILIGIVLMSIGAELIIHAGLGMGPYEAFMYIFVYNKGFKFAYVKYVCDAIFLILCILMKGQAGPGTIITYVLMPKTMEFFAGLVHKYVKL